MNHTKLEGQLVRKLCCDEALEVLPIYDLARHTSPARELLALKRHGFVRASEVVDALARDGDAARKAVKALVVLGVLRRMRRNKEAV